MPAVQELLHVPLSKIRPNVVALRGVNKDTEDYRNLRDSVGRNGVMQSVNVRRKQDEADGSEYFELIDGLHRYTAATETGRDSMPVAVMNASDIEVLETQIMGNLLRIETPPAAYAKQLRRMLAMNQLMTLKELGEKISQSEDWVRARLNLTKLTPELQKYVDDGTIKLQSAYALAKLPPDEQDTFLEQAISLPPQELVPLVNARVTAINKAIREGRKTETPTYEHTPHFRKRTELDAELSNPTAVHEIVAVEDLKTPQAGFLAGIKWVLCMDAASVKAGEEKWSARQKQMADDAAKRAAERAEKKAQENAEKAKQARAEADARLASASA